LKNDLSWGLVSQNENLNFTIPFVRKYHSLLNFYELPYNKAVYRDNSLVEYLGITSNPLVDDEEYLEFEAMRNAVKSDSDYHPNICYHKLTSLEIEKNKELIDWKHFSSNELIEWNKQILYKYKDFFWFGENHVENKYITDGLELYNNESVPWDIEVLRLFEDKVLIHKEVIKQFLQNRTLIKNIQQFMTEEFFNSILIELKFN
jgi:hypothetical protein